ncbi:hypothetical protein NDU88_001228 [Pleurodeles waltl]|uniref:non-specific serine/threonine protein kinase n=1 Tax=Pleurodeles waltl TaxID=8319 RepID=A0AAV7US69_PLEWA|nr:hypothetical protein NDU88_001228 [Pleurodeles waltl]
MPSPVPVERFLSRECSPSVELRAYSSSPLVLFRKGGPLSVSTSAGRERRLPPRLAWCSINWSEVCLLEPLGAGGFGHVYRATYNGETVAVKKVKRCARNRLASRRSFWAELNVAQLPRHDNLVRVLAAGPCGPEDPDNLGAVIMEYAGSCTLHHAIYSNQTPESAYDAEGQLWEIGTGAAICLRYARDVARGLSFLHSHSIVHLDLKPANVLLARQGIYTCCKIGDFGCSLRLQHREARAHPATACQIGGTYTHRAPELLRGLPATRKSDIYSFAVTLWQMVSRETPFTGGERQYVLYAVVAYHLRPSLTGPSFSCPGARGAPFKGIIERCWAAKPEERPGAKQLLEELNGIHDPGPFGQPFRLTDSADSDPPG